MSFSGFTLGSPNTVQVGQNTAKSFPTGTQAQPRGGQLGEAIVANLHGKNYEQAYRGNSQFAYAGFQTVTSLNTTATGLIILNPANSPVNLVLNKAIVHVSVTSASSTGISLAYALAQTGVPTTTPTSSGSCLIGGPAGYAKTGMACTMQNTPVVFAPLLHNTAAIATTGEDLQAFDFEGSFIIPPGVAVLLNSDGGATAASAVSATLTWEEVPI
jgi:hypothetical protein